MLYRVASWLIFGLFLSIVPLGVVAFMHWTPDNSTYWNTLVNQELLLVGFTLAFASGSQALVASSPLQDLKRIIGGLTIVSAVLAGLMYIVFLAQLYHQDPQSVRSYELIVFTSAVALALISEMASD